MGESWYTALRVVAHDKPLAFWWMISGEGVLLVPGRVGDPFDHVIDELRHLAGPT
jgi:hypothetical protein